MIPIKIFFDRYHNLNETGSFNKSNPIFFVMGDASLTRLKGVYRFFSRSISCRKPSSIPNFFSLETSMAYS